MGEAKATETDRAAEASDVTAQDAKPQKSDLSRAFSEDGAHKTHVGGQALIEGIMMRGKYNWSVAVREPEGGIYVEEHDLSSGRAKNGWMYWPLIRGCRALVESLVLGFKALEIAAVHAFGEEEEAPERGASTGAAPEHGEAFDGAPSSEKPSEDASRSAAHSPTASPDSCAALLQSDEEKKFGMQRVDAGDSPSGGAALCASDASGASSDGMRSERGAAATSQVEARGSDSLAETKEPFSWKDDFGRPDTMMDALGAQTTLQVVSDPHIAGKASEAARGASECGESAAERTSVGEQDSKLQEGVSRADAASKNSAEASIPAEQDSFGHKEMVISMVVGLVLGVVLFIVAPAFLTNLIVGEYDSNTLVWNVVDGLLRVAVFVFYLWLIGRMQEIKRMFGYHGAEHKTIHCYEHGLALTPEHARSFPRLHVRCGTAFLIMVMIIAILVYTVTPLNALIDAWGVPDGAPKLALVILVRILLMPVIAGVSYEITVKWAGSHPDNPLVKVVLWPGMQMQYLTTNEPDDGQIECAIAAMRKVLEREEAEAGAPSPAPDADPEGAASAAA